MSGKSLDDLEGIIWGEPTFDSHLVTTCHRLRTKPIDEFTVEDLRIMIGQKIGLAYLMPVAIGELERNPLAEGEHDPGDLLVNVIAAAEWLQSHPELLQRTTVVAERALISLGEENDDLRSRINIFLASNPD